MDHNEPRETRGASLGESYRTPCPSLVTSRIMPLGDKRGLRPYRAHAPIPKHTPPRLGMRPLHVRS